MNARVVRLVSVVSLALAGPITLHVTRSSGQGGYYPSYLCVHSQSSCKNGAQCANPSDYYCSGPYDLDGLCAYPNPYYTCWSDVESCGNELLCADGEPIYLNGEQVPCGGHMTCHN